MMHLARNNTAIIGYPIFLVVSLSAAALVITLSFISISNLQRNLQIKEIEKQLSSIISEAENMIIYSDNNSIHTIQINLPDNLRLAVLGGIPSKTGEPLQFNNTTCKQYYYIMKDGTIRIHHTNIYFLSENLNESIILTPGKHTIILKLYKEGEITYVTVTEKQ